MGGGEVLKKGWLVKSPPLEGGGMKSWRKRFFLLRSSKILEYYKCENGDIKGVVNLEDCVSVHADLFHKKYKHVFDIQTRDRTYYLVAPSAEEMNSWVTSLCKLCEFTTQDVVKASRSSSTLPGNISVVKTPLPEVPTVMRGSKFSPEMERYLLSPEVVELLRSKPKDPAPSGVPFQDALVDKDVGSHYHSHSFSYPSSLRTSTGSSVDSPVVGSQRSSQDQEYFSTRFSTSSTEGQSDSTSSFTYDTPTNNQPADTHSHSVPSHYDVPRSSLTLASSSDRAQLLSNNYMVPRLARISDPLYHYDYLPPPRPANSSELLYPHYDYLPKRDILPSKSDVPLPPRSTDVPLPPPKDADVSLPPKAEVPLPPRAEVPLPPRAEVPLPPRAEVPLPPKSTEVSLLPGSDPSGLYDVPPHPRPLVPHPPSNSEPIRSLPVDSRHSMDCTDCPTPQQGDLPPPQIIFRRDSKGNEMIPNKMYEMVWASEEDFTLVPNENGNREELEDTLTVISEPTKNRQYVNLCVIEEDIPPPVDRSLKPGAAPKIDRSNKPRAQDGSEPVPAALMDTEEMFSSREIPRLTSHSVHYAQVSFDRKKPVPTPRSNRTPISSPQRRVNYCHIDINATNSITHADTSS